MINVYDDNGVMIKIMELVQLQPTVWTKRDTGNKDKCLAISWLWREIIPDIDGYKSRTRASFLKAGYTLQRPDTIQTNAGVKAPSLNDLEWYCCRSILMDRDQKKKTPRATIKVQLLQAACYTALLFYHFVLSVCTHIGLDKLVNSITTLN